MKDDEIIPVGFSVCFPVEHRSLNSTTLLHWTKGYETGNDSNDPVEGMDVAALLDCAFWRLGLQVQTKVVINDTVSLPLYLITKISNFLFSIDSYIILDRKSFDLLL